MEKTYAESLMAEYPIVSFMDIGDAMQNSDFVLVVGGDGTILHIAPLAAYFDKPVLGINLGTLGFLSELDANALELIKNVGSDDYALDDRLLLNVTVKDSTGSISFSATGLNDAAVMKGDISKIAKLKVFVNGKKVMGFSGDGVVVCTPTGSTAYSRSAGGPIIEPTSSCIAVTPVCPHSLGIKSFVVSSDREIEITAPDQDNTIQLSVDGYQNVRIEPGQSIVIRQSPKMLSLIRLRGIGFYERINQKLSIERI